ncbi:type IV pilus twitching motility protein PilT [Nostoc sp. FACHB-973]|uniref:type IV pilus twitching motility protein PilT n=1 Tax=Desmonostoc muscorum TaxID=1179 RepID=UPI0016856F76|nr:type IV pilus twitching motility protein PilT [Desmonostoc muscorum]MBD2518950.1 type IV pilus twitching motility protein PilT [Nostoc sp. FACHB-973]MBX9254895.1 type IV pilus twitching motility protein PilT [Desmonostoc muscorum CCALA 125]MCF2151298.1 type IV pilus twitching motility protein PilT [Desmonostoc muscorum LEGE 12446]
MTESQSPLSSNSAAGRNLPPAPPAPPPPPPGMSTQRQMTQTLDMSANSPAVNSAPVAGHRPGTPPPIPSSARPKSSPPGLTLAQIIREAYDQGYSDIHLGVGEVPRFRNRGEIQPTDYPETDKESLMSWLREVMTEAEIQRFEEHLEFDGATQYEFARVRINVFGSLKGPAMVLRLIPLKILTMEQLRLPPVFRDICHHHKGLILVTGPTGSGKSTTMAAMIDYINKEMAKHIITIEDPIEFVHQSRKSLVKQREVGMHTRKFDNALKAALREDPDLILVGEMRDKETVNTALKAAQTGHLVMGTLHTNSAVKTIERILNLYSGEEQDAMRVAISESLVAIIAQGLCRTTDGKRAAFHDVLINTEAIKEWIKDGKYDEIGELMKQASFDGMITMNQSLLNLYQDGRITEETALEMSPTPNEMAQFLRGRV